MKITIPQPCHENWDTMTPDEKGRFCSVCSKTVRDFTLAADKEIMEVLTGSPDTICGNFYESQLNRNLHYSYVNSLLMKFAVGFMFTAGGWVSVQAQQTVAQDTLQAGKVEDIAVLGLGKTYEKKMLGSVTVVPGNLLCNQPAGEVVAKVSGSVFKLPEERTAYPMMRGAISSGYRENAHPLYILNGKEIDYDTFLSLDQKLIKDIKVLNSAQASHLFNGTAMNGIIMIKTKKNKKSK